MQGPTLRESRAQGPMEALLEVEDPPPFDDMGEKVAIKGRVVGEQLREVQRALGSDQLLQAHLSRGHLCPVPRRDEPMVGVGSVLAYPFEDHGVSLGVRVRGWRARPPVCRVVTFRCGV